MSEDSAPPAGDEPLVVLAYELLDAHLDTVALMPRWIDELGWRAHLDYLRALVRKAEEMLAQVSGPEAASVARGERGP